MSSGRNRSEGWRHAKLSGHALEDELAERIRSDAAFSEWLLQGLELAPPATISGVGRTGIAETGVPSVLPGSTKAKADLALRIDGGQDVTVSLKKCPEGQAWLVQPSRFIAGFEAHFASSVPSEVRRGLKLFFGPVPADEMQAICGGDYQGPIRRKDGVPQERHQKRFVAATLALHDNRTWTCTLEWMRDEISRICDLALRRGLCARPEDWASYVWHHEAGSASPGEGRIASLERLVERIDAHGSLVAAGPRNGGSTLELPFGRLQMHQQQMQFRHDADWIHRVLATG